MWNKPLRNFSAAGVAVLLVGALAGAIAPPREDNTGAPWREEIQQLANQVYRERVIDLPEDAGTWHTTVVYPTAERSDAASRHLAAALAGEPRLQSLVAQTKTHVYTQNDPLWRDRLQKHYGTTAPAIIVQQPDGRVCYKASGANLPSDGQVLATQIATAIGQCRPRPTPQPTPSPTPTPPTIPDVGPAVPAPAEEPSGVLWMIVVPVLAGFLGLYQEWKQST